METKNIPNVVAFRVHIAEMQKLVDGINNYLQEHNITEDKLIDIKYTGTHEYISALLIIRR